MTSKLKVSEIFGPTIQGEGSQIGRPTVFVRLGGCDYRCSWCDSLHAVLPEHRHLWKTMDVQEVLADVAKLSRVPVLITLSGGNPALQAGCEDFITLAQEAGYTVTMETQGSIRRVWMRGLDHLCVSPKPPSSGMATDWEALRQLLFTKASPFDDGYTFRPKDTILKVVVFDDADLDYAEQVRHRFPHIPMYVQVGNHDVTAGQKLVDGAPFFNMATEATLKGALMDKLRWLTEEVLKREWYDVRVLPQLHVLMYGNKQAV